MMGYVYYPGTYNVIICVAVPDTSDPVHLGCWLYGPENADNRVEQHVNEFIAGQHYYLIEKNLLMDSGSFQ